MKTLKLIMTATIALAIASIGATALAYDGHHGYGGHYRVGTRVGVFIGAPVFGFGFPSYGYSPYGYAGYAGYGYPRYGFAPYGYYGPATTVITQAAPPVYIEQGSTSAIGPAADGYWYYCNNPDGYYPYVRQCPNGWQQVSSQPLQR